MSFSAFKQAVRHVAGFAAWCAPAIGFAQQYNPAPINIGTGVVATVPHILQGFIDTFLLWSGLVATALFVLGAFILVSSGGEETRKESGKKIMKSAVIGFAIVLGSWMIISTVVFFIAA